MTPKQITDIYISNRASMSVAEAAQVTLLQCRLTPSSLVDLFGAGILDSNEHMGTMQTHRNELLSYFTDLVNKA
ncbi:hypothetical protein GCM10023213_24140 [Prosthecobacter algae]|uniref:Uncharacterized protein n=1 Tax=Prosthecobacter algae TaxID=1144682 RepID=A0ABP9P877_9BACT